jgi:hypothetical protein
MIEQKDISKVIVICDRIDLHINRDKVAPTMKVDFNLGASWGVYALRQDKCGIKSKVRYALKSDVLEGEIDVTVVINFNHIIDQEELTSKENQKIYALKSVDYIIQWIADISSKMGVSPLIISPQLVTDLIKNAK